MGGATPTKVHSGEGIFFCSELSFSLLHLRMLAMEGENAQNEL